MGDRWKHQEEGFQRLKPLAGGALFMEMGTGKTRVALDLLQEWDIKWGLIVCPKAVLPVWPIECEKHHPGYWTPVVIDGKTPSRKLEQSHFAERLHRAGDRVLMIINYEAAWRDPIGKFLQTCGLHALVLDECVPSNTMIATPRGDIPIQELQIGDIVYGIDHTTGQRIKNKIKYVFNRMSDAPLLPVANSLLTGNHPVWTGRGYINADSLKSDDFIYEGGYSSGARSYLRMVQDAVCSRQAQVEREIAEILRDTMLGQMENVAPGVCGHIEHGTETGIFSPFYGPLEREGGCPGEACCSFILRQQSLQESVSQAEGSQNSREEGIPATQRRQWQTPVESSIYVGKEARLENGICVSNKTLRYGIPNPLQDRYCQPGPNDCHRSPWLRTSNQGSKGEGYQETTFFGIQGVDCINLLEPRNIGQFRGCNISRPVSRTLYNLETETGNYFANGLLVHNCHRIKAPGGKASRYFATAAKTIRRRLALTGTPLPHSPLDIYAQYRTIAPHIFGFSFVGFRAKYAVMRPLGNVQVIQSFVNLDELHEKMYSIAFRVQSRDVLDLPPYMDEIRTFELSPKARRVYDELEEDLVAEIGPGEIISTPNILTKLLRLQQIACGWITADDGPRAMNIDTGKAETLGDLLEDIDEPFVVFCRFIKDIESVRKLCDDRKIPVAEISGARKELSLFQSGQARAVVCQITSGGLGIDLTRARYCFYYSTGHSLGDYQQSRARVHRPGQERPVTYYHLIAKGTVDEDIYNGLQRKGDLVTNVLDTMRRRREQNV